MGCGHSKRPRGEEASPAVALCRDRSTLLADAIDRRYELADAHRAYAASLGATGAALRDFLRAVHDATPPPPPPVPAAGDALLLAAPREGDDADAVVPPAVVASPDAASDEEDVDGGSGGHIYFPSPSDEDEASDDGDGLSESDYDDEAAEPSLPVPEPLHPTAPGPRPRPAQLLPPPQPLPQPPLQTMAPPYVPYNPGYGYPMQYSSSYPQPPYSYGPVVPTPSYGYGYGYGGGYGADMAGHSQSSYHISYARSQPPPPYVPYEHRLPQATDAAAVEYYQYQGEPIPSSSYGGGYFPSTYPQGGGWSPVSGQVAAPPLRPTPSPPRASAWDFLDPFQGVESFYDHQDHHPALDAPAPPAAHAAAPPSLSSHDAGAGEDDDDIPELEDESGVVVGREDHAGDERGVDDAKPADEDILGEEEEKEKENEGHIEFRSDDASTVERVESVVEAVEEEQLNDDSGVVELPAAVPEMKTYGDDVEVVQEIKVQFDRASNSAGNVCKMLEVGKMPYCQKKNSGLIRVPSVMICGRPSKGRAIMQFEEENAMECGNLSSTLQKLYLWEKKLLEEVKIVEKIRVHYEQKRKDQIKLYHGGAEAHKLEAVEIVVKKLSAKMSIAIKIVNTTAEKINNTRDEELWPQIHELIQGFMQMWHTMSECHQVQCRALSYARCIDSTMAVARFNQGHMDLVKQLELQLLDMTASFAGLFNAQKSYATSLNEWLKRGIRYEPEVTDDGVPPFSPGRLGAPPLFSVCNNWAVSMERISGTEAVGAMQSLASNVLGLWEQHRSEWRKAVLDNSNDLERDLRSMGMDELVLRKAVEARSKKLMLATNQRGISSSAQASEAPHAEAGLQACMDKVFEAMESFAAACENVYKDLHLRAEEEEKA